MMCVVNTYPPSWYYMFKKRPILSQRYHITPPPPIYHKQERDVLFFVVQREEKGKGQNRQSRRWINKATMVAATGTTTVQGLAVYKRILDTEGHAK